MGLDLWGECSYGSVGPVGWNLWGLLGSVGPMGWDLWGE